MPAFLKSRFDDINKELDKMADELANQAAHMVMNRAKELVPTQTGELEQTMGVIKYDEGKYNVVAPAQAIKGGSRSGAYYGMYVEYGTKNRAATPFMGPAVEQEREAIVGLFNDELKKL